MALLAMIPTACKRPAHEPSAPAIKFLTDSFDAGDIGWMTEQADEFGVDLNVSGLCAIDKDVAFLFGGVGVAAGTIRSLLLQTVDGGKSWHEVMSPVLGSELTHVTFSDHQHGWALAMWAVEGPGNVLLFGSTDEGKSWRQLTDFQQSPGHAVLGGFPLSMTFTSALNGEIELVIEGESTSIDDTRMEIGTLGSDDGGATWSMVRRETRARPPMETTVAHHHRCADNADWELVTRAVGDPITIRRFDRAQKHWRVTTLPTHFQYERGRVLSSQTTH
jgi:photosystem II stability/assembly factor-like uncharacterized protein